jgi:DNA-binding transcriptional LysR family regulator
MEMHQIRYFLAAARTLSFTRAAEECHVSQPALTAATKKLEAELGSPLFFREANGLQLTAFGRQMTPLLEQISARTEAASAAARASRRRGRSQRGPHCRTRRRTGSGQFECRHPQPV